MEVTKPEIRKLAKPFDKKEFMLDYNKRYYADNRVKHLAYMSTKLDCVECNSQFVRAKRAKHFRSNKHLQNAKIFELLEQLKDMNK
jgi:hypothetical protein